MKKLLSLLLTLCIMVSLFTFAPNVKAADGNPEIISVVAMNDTQFEITTSTPITIINRDCFALFFQNGNQPITERFGGTISAKDNTGTKFVWTADAGTNATKKISQMAGYTAYFGFNGAPTNGIVDTGRVVGQNGKGFIVNLDLNIATHEGYGVPVEAYKPITAKEVRALSDYKLEIEFSKEIASFNGAVLLGVLNNAKTEFAYPGTSSDTLDDYVAMKFEVIDGKLVCWLEADKLGDGIKDRRNITEIVSVIENTYEGYSAGIVLLEANEPSIINTGYLEQVKDNGYGILKATSKMNNRDSCAVQITDTYESARLVSATRINDNSLKVKFDKEVTIASDNGGFGIVALDENGEILFDSDEANKYMRYGGTMDKTTGTEFIWTIDSSIKRSVTDIMLDWQAKGYTVMFCSNSSGSQNAIYHNSRVVDENGNPILAPVAKQHTASAKLYYALCSIEPENPQSVEIESVIAKDDFRFEVKFTDSVKILNDGCGSLMAFDDNGVMVFDGGTEGIAAGKFTESSGTGENDTWTWTISENIGTATETINNWIEQGYKVKFSVNGDGQMAEGTLVNNRVTDGAYSCLKKNYYNTGTKQNCHVIAVSAYTDSDVITIDSVVYSGSSQLIVTFSEPVEIAQPGFIGLRIVDVNGNYIEPIEGTPGSQHNMVWEYVNGSNKTQIVLTFHSKHMLSMLELTGLYESYSGNGNHTVFMIGEKTTNIRNARIDDIVGSDGNGALEATYAHLVYQESNMQNVTADTRTPLTVVSATAINDTDIIIKFSAPVEIEYSPFICLRVVDENNNQVFGENGTRLQYPGTWKYADDKHDTIIWTSDNWNVKGLLSLTGPWARFNKDGNATRLCIEELEDKEKKEIDVVGNGFIDNITDANGMMLTANSIAGDMNTYDGLYIDVKEDYEEPAFYLKEAIQINAKQIALVFNKPVYFEGNPFMAIRFVNEANVLQYDGKTPLQYQGTWSYGNDEKTILVWTATYGGSVTAIMNRTAQFANYPDYKIMFCIEEIPADKIKGDVEDGTIHNMYTDGGIKLYSNVVGYGTNWDGVYMPITVDFNYKVPNTGDNGITLAVIGMIVTIGTIVFVVNRKKSYNH